MATCLMQNMHSIQIIEERSSIFDHSFFCDAWRWIYLATSMCQPADQQMPMDGHCIYEILPDVFTLCNLISGGISLDGSHIRTVEAWCPWVQLSRPLRLSCRFQMCNDCNTFKIWQPYKNILKIIRQQYYLQVACNDNGRISVSRRPACMSLYLANGYLLMTEDVLGFVII